MNMKKILTSCARCTQLMEQNNHLLTYESPNLNLSVVSQSFGTVSSNLVATSNSSNVSNSNVSISQSHDPTDVNNKCSSKKSSIVEMDAGYCPLCKEETFGMVVSESLPQQMSITNS